MRPTISGYLYTEELINFSADEHLQTTSAIEGYHSAITEIGSSIYTFSKFVQRGTNRPIKIADFTGKVKNFDR